VGRAYPELPTGHDDRSVNAFDGGPVQPPTIGLDQLVWMTKQLVWDLNQLV